MKKKYPLTDQGLRDARPTENAQGLVEFALILPVILITIFVLVELARVLHAWLAIENGARAGIRYAVTAEFNTDYCPPAGCSTEKEEFKARVASIHDAAWAGSSSVVRVGMGDADPDEKSYFNVVVCDAGKIVAPATTFETHQCHDEYGNPFDEYGNPYEDPGEPGDRVVVVVEFNHPLLAPILTSVWPHLRLNATRQAKVETYRIPLPVGTVPDYKSPTPKPTNTPNPTNTPPGPPKPPDCDFVDFWLVGNDSEHWIKAIVVGYPVGGEPPGAIYEMVVSEIRIGHHPDDDDPTLNNFKWETWNEPTRTDSIKEEGYVEFEPVPSYNVAHCYPGGCSDYHYKGTLTANFDDPITRQTSVRVEVRFPAFPTVVCFNWKRYITGGYVPDTPGPYISDTPNPNPPTNTPTIEWSPPTPTFTEDLGGPSD
jgi:hypothetical protein